MPTARTQLSKAKRTAISSASHQRVTLAVQELRPSLQKSLWLKHNRYKTDVLGHLDKEKQSQRHDPKKLAHYVAASIPLHCSDGWAFLAQSVSSLLNGDWASALHLAYYAELRASMSFLASEGIAVFHRYHVCIDAAGGLHSIKGEGTHDLAWKALEHWARLKPSGSRLLSLIKTEGITVEDWLVGAGVSRAAQTTLAANWLRRWSMDLRLLSQDRELRNIVSYRPTRLHQQPSVESIRCCDTVTQFWRACEPGTPGSFSVLDMHLLRIALEKGFESTRSPRSRTPDRWRDFIRRAVDARGYLASTKADEMVAFLTRQKGSADHELLATAERRGTTSGVEGALPVIARATILLRVASAACASHFQQGNLGMVDLEFWWESYGRDFGLWDIGSPPDRFGDLWKDIEDAIVETDEWCKRNRGQSPTVSRMRQDLGSHILQLCSFQRAGLWSLGIEP